MSPSSPRSALLGVGLSLLLAAGLAPAALAAPASAQVAPGEPPAASETTPPTGTTPPVAPPTTPPSPGPLPTATVGATVPTVPPPATAPGPATVVPAPTISVLRMGVSSTLVRGTGVLTVSGRTYRAADSPAVGVVLDVLGRTPGTTGFARIGRMTTGGDGLATLRFVPRVTREYQLRTAAAPAAVSNPSVVQVQPLLTGTLTPRVTQLTRSSVLSGRLEPAYAGARVQVQRRTAAGWSAVTVVGTAADGTYRWAVTPGATGRYVFRAVLPAAAAHRAAPSLPVDLVVQGRVLRGGDRGADVFVLQQRLRAQKVDVGPVDGAYGYDLRHAVTAFQKSQGLPRTGVYDKATSARLASPRPVVLRHPARGRAVEVDLTKQVLYVSEGGRLTRVVDVSTGNDELYESDGVTYRAFTPTGRYGVQRKIDGIRVSRLGELYRPAYFHQGWAIHGSPKVPVYPDSHGCVRVTNGAMDRLYDLLRLGVPVSLYRS